MKCFETENPIFRQLVLVEHLHKNVNSITDTNHSFIMTPELSSSTIWSEPKSDKIHNLSFTLQVQPNPWDFSDL